MDTFPRKVANEDALALFSITNTMIEIVKAVGEKMSEKEFADEIQNSLNREMAANYEKISICLKNQ